MRISSRGVTILETVIALALIGMVGSAFLRSSAESMRVTNRAEIADRRLDEMQETISSLAVLSRTELDSRIGKRSSNGLVVHVIRPDPTLYRISITQTDGAVGLVTVVYRAELSRE